MKTIQHNFVEYIPAALDEDVLYISIHFGIATHKCFCGCGTEVNTPLSPKGWTLHFDGDTVSLSPSIGNWSLPCRSHYWIEKNSVYMLGKGTKRPTLISKKTRTGRWQPSFKKARRREP